MSRVSARAARREREAAKVLGARRVVRQIGESAPDVTPVTLPSGLVLQAEVKSTKRPPKLVLDALEQARAYRSDAVPLVVVAPFGGEMIACLPLSAFAQIAGLQPIVLPVQPSLPTGVRS
ncbi:MAG: hypothetical protein JNL79_29295 [Myxococcales bacterium]|nr:hypothetical protein [Myxococcales bacterium]